MSTEMGAMTVRGIPVVVVRKDIKNLHLAVYPPDGRVRIAVPTALSDSAINAAIAGKLPWIRRQQSSFQRQARESAREMVSGETHWLDGRRYRLRVVQSSGRSGVAIVGRAMIELRCPPGSSIEERAAALDRWYRARLREIVPPLLERWASVAEVEVPDWRIKRMKTKWGSYGEIERRIWLNLELAKKPRRCLEYVLVHELVHLAIRRHGPDFKGRLDELLPHWRLTRGELGALPLGHARWPD